MRLPAAFAVAALVLAACAEPSLEPQGTERVVLLPGSDGKTGALVVQQGERSVTLDTPYAAADGALQATHADAEQVRAEFGEVLAALPPAPVSYTVYFVFGQDELTEDSRKELGSILEAIGKRPAPEITAIGHADQAGPERINDSLAVRRAERVREVLVQRGVRADRISVVGRGSREPAIRAAEGVAEARNRRVEISVR